MSDNAISAQGSTLHIGTGSGGAKNITAVTKAYRGELTSTSHGLAVGDRVTIASLGGMTELNGQTPVVIDVDTNTFVIDVDTRAYTTYTSGGTATPVTWTEILEIKSFSPGGATVSDVDTTDLSATAKTGRAGMVDNGEFSFDINYLSTDPGQAALLAAFTTSPQVNKSYKLTDPGATTYSFSAYIKNYPTVPKGSIDGILQGSVTLKISGSVTIA